MSLRIAFYGGIFLPLAKSWQNNADYHCDFLWDSQLSAQVGPYYSSEFQNMPNVSIDNYSTRKDRFWPKTSRLTQKLQTYDFLIVSEDGCIFAQASQKPFAFVPLGYDLASFASRVPKVETFFSLFANIYSSFVRKKAICKSKFVIAPDFPVFRRAIRNLKLEDKWINEFLPTPIDWPVYEETLEMGSAKKLEEPFLVFSPNRVMFTKTDRDSTTGQTKNTELAIRGFRSFIEVSQRKSLLYLIKRGSKEDLQLLDALVVDLNLSEFVVWLGINGPLSSSEMKSLYAKADVVIGDLGSSWFGKSTIESISQGTPLVCKMEKDMVDSLEIGEGCFRVETKEDIAEKLVMLSELPNSAMQVISNSLKLSYKKYFSEQSVINLYKVLIDKMLTS